jgi:O-antigen ligase
MVIGAMVIASMLSREQLGRWYVRGVQVSIGTTIAILLTDSSTRVRPLGHTLTDAWRGGFNHKNDLAVFAAFMIPWVLAFAARGWSRALTLGSLAVLIVGSRSATGLIGMVLGGVMWWWLGQYQRRNVRSRASALAATTLVVVAVVCAMAISLSAIAAAYGKDTTFTGRTSIWSVAVEKAASRPLVGYGPAGLFSPPLSQDALDIWRAARSPFAPAHAHNGLLQVQLDLGAVGVLLVLALLIGCVRDGVRLLDRDPVISRWLIAGVSVIAVMSVSEPVFSRAGWIGSLAIMRVVAIKSLRADRSAGRRRPVELSEVDNFVEELEVPARQRVP